MSDSKKVCIDRHVETALVKVPAEELDHVKESADEFRKQFSNFEQPYTVLQFLSYLEKKGIAYEQLPLEKESSTDERITL